MPEKTTKNTESETSRTLFCNMRFEKKAVIEFRQDYYIVQMKMIMSEGNGHETDSASALSPSCIHGEQKKNRRELGSNNVYSFSCVSIRFNSIL